MEKEQNKQIDLLAKKALEHDKRFDGIENKVDGLEKNILSTLDKNTEILEKISQEQDATSAVLVHHDKEIQRIKDKLEIRQ